MPIGWGVYLEPNGSYGSILIVSSPATGGNATAQTRNDRLAATNYPILLSASNH